MNKRTQIHSSPRRFRAKLSVAGITQIHLRNPFIVAFWSAMFPGLGHMILEKFVRAYILFIWEIVINIESHLNDAILYSFTGEFQSSKDVINYDWIWLYIPTYLFAIWDSYRTTVDLNHQYLLAAREDAGVKTLSISAVELDYLDKKNPLITLLWSALSPGLGYLYIFRLPASLFTLVFWTMIMVNSKALSAIQYTLLGDFEKATSVINHHWFLNISSVYFASMYDSYLKTIENNKLYEWEQSKFLKNNYQDNSFIIPTNRITNRGKSMYVISTFDHSIHLEEAITAIQMKGIAKEDILAVPLDKKNEEQKLFDTIQQSDGVSLLDTPMMLACVFTLLGGIYGFILKWGPIIWGLISMIIGFSIGLAIKLIRVKKYLNTQSKNNLSEVVLIIECMENQSDMVKDILWQNKAFGVRKLVLGNDKQ